MRQQRKVRVSRWGNSLAIRLPKSLSEKLNLKEGDALEISNISPGHAFNVNRVISRKEALDNIFSMRGMGSLEKFIRDNEYD